MVIDRLGATLLRAAGWIGVDGCCGGGHVVGMKGFTCGLSLFCMVDVGRDALATAAARCGTEGGSDGGDRVGGC